MTESMPPPHADSNIMRKLGESRPGWFLCSEIAENITISSLFSASNADRKMGESFLNSRLGYEIFRVIRFLLWLSNRFSKNIAVTQLIY